MSAVRQKVRLGDLLVEQGAITSEQLETALAEQKASGRKLGKVLMDDGYLSEDTLVDVLSKQLKLQRVDLARFPFDQEVVRLIPEVQARRFRAIALRRTEKGVLVGMSDPTNIFGFDEISRLVKEPLQVAVVRESELLRTFDSVYRNTEEILSFAGELSEELSAGDIDMQELVASADVADAPVVKLLQSLFEDAVQIGASDIHIEPDETVLRIRQRIDGLLQEQVLNQKRIVPSLVLRLKLIAGLDISEKRLPQDGRFSIRVDDRLVDVRISTMPVQHGESVVMRLLDQSKGIYTLEALGMPEDIERRLQRVISRPHGMVLVTGPTGSGKTTTLYAALQTLNDPAKKIITVEDPVEYRLERVNQVQVNTDIGLSFGRVLRSTLRQDPDIVLVGEMRDEETVEIGLRAALTGHLVLSTLHTNDAISTAIRLIDMGAPGYLMASALHAVIAQRLVRRICESCRFEATPDAQEKAWLRAQAGDAALARQYFLGEGCQRCNLSGYRGRLGVFEMLEMDFELGQALAREDAADFTDLARRARGYRPLVQVAIDYAAAGRTTVAEAMRVAAQDVALEAAPAALGTSLEV